MADILLKNLSSTATGTLSGGKYGLDVNISSADVALGGGTEYTEDAPAAANPTGGVTLMVRDDALAGSLTSDNGDNIAARGNNKGEQYVKATDTDALLTAIDADTSNISTKIDTLAGAVSGTEMQVDVLTVPSDPFGANADAAATAGSTGSMQAKLRLMTSQLDSIKTAAEIMDDWDESDRAKVNLIVGQAGVAAGSGTTGSTTQRVVLATDTTVPNVTGNIAHDSADSGNPLKIGFKAKNFDGTAPGTDVAEDDRVDSISDPSGRQYVNDIHPNYWHVSADYGAAQTNTSVKAAPGAGLKLYITDIFISNGATAGNVTLLNGSGGSVLWECYPGINGGAVLNLRQPIVLSANTALCITSTTVTTHAINVSGFIAA